MAVDIHDFDEDHWFLLFTLDEGVHGHPPYDLLRCKESSLARMNPKYRFGRKMDQISTRLKDGKRLENYDDWDCLDDFINQGLIELFDRDDPRLRLILTGLGSEIKEELSNYILDGGDYSGFYPSILVSQEIRSSLDSIEGPAQAKIEEMFVPMAVFEKDHWNTLLYAYKMHQRETGMHAAKLRCNYNTHPERMSEMITRFEDKPGIDGQGRYRYGSRIKGGGVLIEHDDWDCFEDLEKLGLIKITDDDDLDDIQFEMSENGVLICQELETWGEKGGIYSNFVPSLTGLDLKDDLELWRLQFAEVTKGLERS